MQDDLELASTDDLVEELLRRHDSSVILLAKNAGSGRPEQSTFLSAFDGCVFTAIGMTSSMHYRLQSRVEGEIDLDDESGSETGT